MRLDASRKTCLQCKETDFGPGTLFRGEKTSCAVCDRYCRKMHCKLVAVKDLPHKYLLVANESLLNCAAVRDEFFNYPGDHRNVLDGHVLARQGFQPDAPHHLRVCQECLNSLLKDKMPEAALANGLWLGDFPDHLRGATFVEMMAASPVRISGMVLALDELKVGNVRGSAKSLMRGTFTFYMQDAYGVQLRLPACDTDIAGSFTCALVGAKPSVGQLRKLFGARRKMVEDLLAFQLDKDNQLVGVHQLAQEAQLSAENLDTYKDDGSIPKAIFDALLPVNDSTNAYANARSTHAHGNREPDDHEDGPAPPAAADHADDGAGATPPFIIETNAIMPSGDDLAVSSHAKPGRLRTLGVVLNSRHGGRPSAATAASGDASLPQMAAAQARAAAGQPPDGTQNALVLTHSGQMVSDFHNPGLFVGAYFDLFPHGVGGHLDKRTRPLDLKRWAQILLRRRDARFRKSRTFLYCVCALIFRREAISNARWKLRGRVPRDVASRIAGVTAQDLRAVAAEMETGSSGFSALADRPGIRDLIKNMEFVHAGASWTIYNKRSTRMIAISFIMQMGQPLFWLTINPADVNSPIVMVLAGVELDVTSRLKADFPAYADKLRFVANDPVASADFFHATIDAVLTCLLRFGACDGDGGVLGRVKGYVGMTEEQKRLTLHCHLLVWVYGYNDFASFRELMDKTPTRYFELAEYLDKVIFNQIATLSDINHVMRGVQPSPEVETDVPAPPPDQLMRPAKERMAVPPPSSCFPRDGQPRNNVHDDKYAHLMYLDLAGLTGGANLHKCQATCRKFNHGDSCRFGFGDKGKPLVQKTVVQRGRCVFDTDGNMTINGIVYSWSSAKDAAAAASNEAFRAAFDASIAHLVNDNGLPDPLSDRFTAELRRLHSHINSFNPVIQFAIRSNMDLKILLRDSDAKGLLFYILNYSTKTEQNLDVLLPLLAPVAERIREQSDGAPEKELAVRLVRSCLCKQLSSLSIGGPAAASKVFDLPDHRISHPTVPCSMSPLLTWATSRDGPLDGEVDRVDDSSDDDDQNDSDVEESIIITPFKGKLTVAQRVYLLYLKRCDPNDTTNPVHGMSYVVWHKLVRLERCLPGRNHPAPTDRSDDDSESSGDDEPSDADDIGDDDSNGDDVPATRRPARGRPRANRLRFVGDFKNKWHQVPRFHFCSTLHFPSYIVLAC
ncbi:unnamed protein product [Ectocarpus sp. CCAP 1310/34]|nr:unnamed protein product [Ectocarpus sp. CCAP 1310/34]